MTELPIQRLLLEALAVLENLGLTHAIMGGFAVRAWGVPRPTYDADIAVVIADEEIPDLLRALEAAGFDVPEEHRKGYLDTLAGTDKFRVTRFESLSVWQVDLFVARGPFFDSAISRRRTMKVEGREVPVLAPEDLIVLKLIAHRRKDLLDIEEILKVTPNLDPDYLRRWAAALNVSERLEEFLPPAANAPGEP